MDYREFTGETVDDALTLASVQLGVTSDHIDYEVVEKGSSGFLGLGSKEAVIRARVKGEGDEESPEKASLSEDSSGKSPENADASPASESEEGSHSADGSASETGSREGSSQKSGRHYDRRDDHRHRALTEEEQAEASKEAETFLNGLFAEMQLDVTVTEKFDPDQNALLIDLEGPEMGIIIGKRGQTLDSVQYLTNLAVNRRMDVYVRIKIDTEDYRARREETLRNLARNVAWKVKRNGDPVALESMNANERRIIHSELSDDPEVTTHSEGEEPYRHVVVTLK